MARLALADRSPGLGGPFGHSHNLFIDLVVWTGLPLGILLAAFLVRWSWLRLRAIRLAQDAVLLLLLGVVGVHAMLELPLHYAYFLLPVGLVIGVLHVRLGVQVVRTTPRWTLAALWLAGALALGVTVRDYFHVEASYNTLRFEQARIGLGKVPVGGPPDVLVLTQLREWFRLARYEVRPGMGQAELDWMADVTRAYPSAGALYRLATAFALNDRPEEARAWLAKVCKITDERECRRLRRVWERESRDNPRTAAIAWPPE